MPLILVIRRHWFYLAVKLPQLNLSQVPSMHVLTYIWIKGFYGRISLLVCRMINTVDIINISVIIALHLLLLSSGLLLNLLVLLFFLALAVGRKVSAFRFWGIEPPFAMFQILIWLQYWFWVGFSFTVSARFLPTFIYDSLLPLFMLVKTKLHFHLLLFHFPNLSLYMFLFPMELVFLRKIEVFYFAFAAEFVEKFVLFDVAVDLTLYVDVVLENIVASSTEKFIKITVSAFLKPMNNPRLVNWLCSWIYAHYIK